MRYSGIQPQYLPRLHYFARILNTDIFVLRDDAQFVAKHKYPDGQTGKSYQAHTPIKSEQGLFLLTVPVSHQGYKAMHETPVNYDHDWVESHQKTLKYAYRKALNFDELYPEITTVLSYRYTSIAGLNTATILWAIRKLLGSPFTGIDDLEINKVQKLLNDKKVFRLKRIEKASILAEKGNFTRLLKNEKILALLNAVGAKEDYCGGTAQQAYMDEELFKKNGVSIRLQNWSCPNYPQLFLKHDPFIPNLSIIDLLMNVPLIQARQILRSDE